MTEEERLANIEADLRHGTGNYGPLSMLDLIRRVRELVAERDALIVDRERLRAEMNRRDQSDAFYNRLGPHP